jgi:folate-binding protein YgfZ
MNDPNLQYMTVRREGAGVIDLSSRGRTIVSGSEAVMFLNGLITNDMKTLLPNRWMPAAFPSVQGRLLAAVRVIRLADKVSPTYLLDTEASSQQPVLKAIERFTMAGDFRVTDVTSDTAMFSVQGREAIALGQQVLGDVFSDLSRDGVAEGTFDGISITVIRASHTAEDGFDVVLDASRADAISQAFAKAGVIKIGDAVFETLRIEAGVARFGQDMDETNIITETNLDDAVSFTKGCYIGQEIIARIKYRGHVAKKLTGLTFHGKETVTEGSQIKTPEGKEIGRVTSSTFSPTLDRAIALGYVRYEQSSPGTDVVVGESGALARVTELPFVRGSWYA